MMGLADRLQWAIRCCQGQALASQQTLISASAIKTEGKQDVSTAAETVISYGDGTDCMDNWLTWLLGCHEVVPVTVRPVPSTPRFSLMCWRYVEQCFAVQRPPMQRQPVQVHAGLPWTNSAFCGMCRSMLGQLHLAASAKDQGEPGQRPVTRMHVCCEAQLLQAGRADRKAPWSGGRLSSARVPRSKLVLSVPFKPVPVNMLRSAALHQASVQSNVCFSRQAICSHITPAS